VFARAGLFPVACLKKRTPPLSDAQIPWSLRWKIALDIAKGARHNFIIIFLISSSYAFFISCLYLIFNLHLCLFTFVFLFLFFLTFLRLTLMNCNGAGMKYLHSFKPPIVHRDLRSPNVFVRAALRVVACARARALRRVRVRAWAVAYERVCART
jgi:hypothetical protein